MSSVQLGTLQDCSGGTLAGVREGLIGLARRTVAIDSTVAAAAAIAITQKDRNKQINSRRLNRPEDWLRKSNKLSHVNSLAELQLKVTNFGWIMRHTELLNLVMLVIDPNGTQI